MKPVRFGVIGYGRFGAQHAAAISAADDAELAAISTRSEASASSARADYPNAQVYQDYRKLLSRDDIDVVNVVVPTHLHFEISRAALEAGKNVLVEKPMATTLEECRQLNSLADSGDQVLMVGFKRRVAPVWRRVKQLVVEGAIGEPLYALIDLWRGPYRQGSDGWRYDPERVGSWILEEPVHAFDKARWYFATCGDPVSVVASSSSSQPDPVRLTENFSAMLRFPNGSYVVVSQTLGAFGHHHTVAITGTRGAIHATWRGAKDTDSTPVATLLFKSAEDEEPVEVPLSKPGEERSELAAEVKSMIGAIRTGSAVVATGTDGAWAVGLCEAAEESIRSNSVVQTDRFRP